MGSESRNNKQSTKNRKRLQNTFIKIHKQTERKGHKENDYARFTQQNVVAEGSEPISYHPIPPDLHFLHKPISCGAVKCR